MNISKRIKFLASIVNSYGTVVDVGCDHGYLGYLILKNSKNDVIFTDISNKCLEKAKNLIEKENLNSRSYFVCTNGLENIKNSVDTVVIAGMGGYEILNIIKSAKIKVNKYVLQPMKNVLTLKSELIKIGYKIEFDKIIKDGKKFYEYLIVTKNEENLLLRQDYFFGKDNLMSFDNEFIEYLKFRQKQLVRNSIKEDKLELEELELINKILDKKEL